MKRYDKRTIGNTGKTPAQRGKEYRAKHPECNPKNNKRYHDNLDKYRKMGRDSYYRRREAISDRRRITDLDKRNKRRENHECVTCGIKLEDDYTNKNCPKCIDKRRVRKEKASLNATCSYDNCNNPRHFGTSYCSEHLRQKGRESWRKCHPNTGKKGTQTNYLRDNSKIRKEAMDGKSCLVCSNPDYFSLHFHHIDPSKKVASISSMISKPTHLFIAEMEKCCLLCPTCHTFIHLSGAAEKIDELIKRREDAGFPPISEHVLRFLLDNINGQGGVE